MSVEAVIQIVTLLTEVKMHDVCGWGGVGLQICDGD